VGSSVTLHSASERRAYSNADTQLEQAVIQYLTLRLNILPDTDCDLGANFYSGTSTTYFGMTINQVLSATAAVIANSSATNAQQSAAILALEEINTSNEPGKVPTGAQSCVPVTEATPTPTPAPPTPSPTPAPPTPTLAAVSRVRPPLQPRPQPRRVT
jgi:hypothetical protein